MPPSCFFHSLSYSLLCHANTCYNVWSGATPAQPSPEAAGWTPGISQANSCRVRPRNIVEVTEAHSHGIRQQQCQCFPPFALDFLPHSLLPVSVLAQSIPATREPCHIAGLMQHCCRMGRGTSVPTLQEISACPHVPPTLLENQGRSAPRFGVPSSIAFRRR